MPGPEFHSTRMGQRFYEVTMPRIADELANLNNHLAALIALLRQRAPAPPAAPSQPPAPRK